MSEFLDERSLIGAMVPPSNDQNACQRQNCGSHMEILKAIASTLTHTGPNDVSLSRNPSTPCGVKHLDDLKVELVNEALWKLFHDEEHEMKITNIGRPLFPNLALKFSGLSPNDKYSVSVKFANIDSARYRFSPTTNEWFPWSTAESDKTMNARRCYEHPSSPSQGAFWTAGSVLFDKLRLTNNWAKTDGHMIQVSTLRKYRIQVIVTKINCSHCDQPHVRKVELPLTDFIAVTGYRNKKITQLKIEKNPFSVAFRDDFKKFKASRKRKQEPNLASKKLKTDDFALPETLSCVECSTTSPDDVTRSTPSVDLTDHVSIFLKNDVILYPQFHQSLYPCLGMEQLPDISQLSFSPNIRYQSPTTFPGFQPQEQYTYDHDYYDYESNQSYFYNSENPPFQNIESNTSLYY